MTQDEIIDKDEVLKMARQAQFHEELCGEHFIYEFAKLVADVATAKEREACAEICDDPNRFGPEGEWCASVIRARGCVTLRGESA